jgi:uncharacterized membrane protein
MWKCGSNEIMMFFLAIGGVFFVLCRILSISISNMELNIIFILLFFIIIIIHGWKTLGAREALVFFLFASFIPLLYEYTEGWGFGGLVGCTCSYSNLLGPKFLGKIPYVIPLVWSISLYGTFTMTNIIFNRIRIAHEFEERASLQWFFKIVGMGIVTGLIMASLDLIIDPVMVEMGAWNWSVVGPYYGIPLWNYEGWIEISTETFVCYSVYLLLVKKSQIYIGGEKQSRYTLWVVVLYLASLIVYGMYAVEAQMTYVIPWSVMTMGLFASIAVIQFYRSYLKVGKEVSSSIK